LRDKSHVFLSKTKEMEKNMPDPAVPPPAIPRLDLDAVLTAIGNSQRWQILKLISDGEGCCPTDVAGLLDITVSAASKHLARLYEAGICYQGRGRLCRIRPEFQPDPQKKVLDLGHCLLRLDHALPDTE
jgi:DNA-binding transcriptional ArsR family regulator